MRAHWVVTATRACGDMYNNADPTSIAGKTSCVVLNLVCNCRSSIFKRPQNANVVKSNKALALMLVCSGVIEGLAPIADSMEDISAAHAA